MAERIARFPWGSTPLGPSNGWSETLRVTLRLAIASATPMVMLVGPDGILLYNDAYARFAGARHPGILGLPATEAWPEIADFNRGVIATAMRGEALFLESQPLTLRRNETPEEIWVDLDYTPLIDGSGHSEGMLCIVYETTSSVAMQAELAMSEAKFRALADSMPQMVWSTRPDGFHDYYNARWYEFTGVPSGSTDGEGWNNMFHPDDQSRAWELWRHSLRTGEPYEIEYRLRHHSGEYRWTLGRALPLRDGEGAILRWFGTCTDIHETKLAAEEREMVAQELSHRIKNIFSVLTGIIALSARSFPEAKSFAEQLRQRIFAMGRAHDFVRPHSAASKPRARQSSLQTLIKLLLDPFDDKQGRIRFEGEDAVIDDASATPLALLFHELATNAAKYGALAAEDGTVTITGASEGENTRITWKERAVTVKEPSRIGQGFGSRLMALSVEGQLGGRVERAWEADGLRLEIIIHTAALSRSGRLRVQHAD